MKTVWYWCKDRQTNLSNRIELGNKSAMYGHLIYENCKWEEIIF